MSAWGDSIQSSAAATMLDLGVFTAVLVMCCRCGRSVYSSAFPEAELPFLAENSATLAWGDRFHPSAAATMLELIVFSAGAVIYCGRHVVYTFMRRRLCTQTFRLNFHFRSKK